MLRYIKIFLKKTLSDLNKKMTLRKIQSLRSDSLLFLLAEEAALALVLIK